MTALRAPLLFAAMAGLLVLTGLLQSWSVALVLVNLGLISAIMALGVNIQWGYAGLFSVGTMGFAALGGVAAVLVATPPVPEAWAAGGLGVLGAAGIAVVAAVAAIVAARRLKGSRWRLPTILAFALMGYAGASALYVPATDAIEAVDPALTGYLGGFGLPIVLSWFVGAALAAAAAALIGRIALGLRADYLAIATLGIAEIILAVIKHEDWLARGVKNVTGLPRPVPFEVDLAQRPWVIEQAAAFGMTPAEAASILVKLAYAGLFVVVLAVLLWLAERALRSPWGRMMRAIRDNEAAAAALGKDVTARHREAFVLGSAVIGLAGAMLVTLDGQFTPGGYQPLRFTFLIWVMVIVGGSGNNWGAVLGGFVIWFFWVQTEPLGAFALDTLTAVLGDESALRAHLLDNAAYTRLMAMGVVLLLVLRFAPRGLIPERR
ncbi:MAG: branched-chain amino acid ABC transporter permease [Pseudomonadota bacterium]